MDSFPEGGVSPHDWGVYPIITRSFPLTGRGPTERIDIPLLPSGENKTRAFLRINLEDLETAPSRVLQILERLERAGEFIRHPIERFFLAEISRLHEPDVQLLKAWFQANAGKTAKPKAPVAKDHMYGWDGKSGDSASYEAAKQAGLKAPPPIKAKRISDPPRSRPWARPERARARLSSDPPPPEIEA